VTAFEHILHREVPMICRIDLICFLVSEVPEPAVVFFGSVYVCVSRRLAWLSKPFVLFLVVIYTSKIDSENHL